MAAQLLSLDNSVFRTFVGCSTICLAKTMLMTPMTIRQRFAKGVFANTEDTPLHEKGKVDLADQDVERVRRNHLNDLENIPVFVLLGGLYVLTDPAPEIAIWHFRVFTAARILHTLAYQGRVRQPARALSFFVGFGTAASIIGQIFWAVHGHS